MSVRNSSWVSFLPGNFPSQRPYAQLQPASLYMEVLTLVPGLLRIFYAGSFRQFLLGLSLPFGFLILYLLCAPLAVVLHIWNAAEEAELIP